MPARTPEVRLQRRSGRPDGLRRRDDEAQGGRGDRRARQGDARHIRARGSRGCDRHDARGTRGRRHAHGDVNA